MNVLQRSAQTALLVGIVATIGCVSGPSEPAGRVATSTSAATLIAPAPSHIAEASGSNATHRPTSTTSATWSNTAGSDACEVVDTNGVEAVVALAFDGLGKTTAASAWSSACAWVRSAEGGEPSYRVSVRISWQGSLMEFSSMPNARSIAGIADEAVGFDDGFQIALRDGELVAVVAVTRSVDEMTTPASAATALAQLVAARILGQG